MLFIYSIDIVFGVIAAICLISGQSSFVEGMGIVFGVAVLIFALATLIPGLMLSFRRWRDAGLNGNGILVYFLLLIAFGVISNFYETFGEMMLSLCSIISFVLCVLPSDQLTTTSNNVVLKFLFRQRQN